MSVSPSDIAGRRRDFVVIGRFVLAFLIEGEEAVEFHDLAGGAQFDIARTRLRHDVDRGALEFGGFHLARDRALPDQLVEPRLIAIDVSGDFGGRATGARSGGPLRALPARSSICSDSSRGESGTYSLP